MLMQKFNSRKGRSSGREDVVIVASVREDVEKSDSAPVLPGQAKNVASMELIALVQRPMQLVFGQISLYPV
jgi:hypothetical protein